MKKYGEKYHLFAVFPFSLKSMQRDSPSPFHPSSADITCSGVRARMQAWLRSQCFLPCRVQGRQSSFASSTRSFEPAGKKPHSSVVGPNRAKTGVPTAPARCIGPESPVINTEEARNSAHVSRRDVRLVKSRDAGTPSMPLPRPMTIHGMPRTSNISISWCQYASFHALSGCVAYGCKAIGRISALSGSCSSKRCPCLISSLESQICGNSSARGGGVASTARA